MKTIYAKRTGKREAITGGEEPQAAGGSAIGYKRKRKAGDSDDDDDEDEDSEDAGDEDEEEEEEEAKKGKKVEICDEVKCVHFGYSFKQRITLTVFSRYFYIDWDVCVCVCVCACVCVRMRETQPQVLKSSRNRLRSYQR